MARRYQRIQALLPEIKEMLLKGKSQREVAERLGLKGGTGENCCLLALAALAKEIERRGAGTEVSVTIAAGLPPARYSREKQSVRADLLRSPQPARFSL